MMILFSPTLSALADGEMRCAELHVSKALISFNQWFRIVDLVVSQPPERNIHVDLNHKTKLDETELSELSGMLLRTRNHPQEQRATAVLRS